MKVICLRVVMSALFSSKIVLSQKMKCPRTSSLLPNILMPKSYASSRTSPKVFSSRKPSLLSWPKEGHPASICIQSDFVRSLCTQTHFLNCSIFLLCTS